MRIIRYIIRVWMIRKRPVEYARPIGVGVGEGCRILALTPTTFGSEPYLVRLGHHVTVTAGVRFITHDGGVWVFRDRDPNIDVFGPISVGNNVFIGINAIIMPNVNIGNNAVIGAGSVVTKDVPANCIAVGVPARPLKTLDEYWEKVQQDSFSIRHLPYQAKRDTLEQHFFGATTTTTIPITSE